MEFSLKNTQIDELFEMELISVRTLHICEDNYLPDTTAISELIVVFWLSGIVE